MQMQVILEGSKYRPFFETLVKLWWHHGGTLSTYIISLVLSHCDGGGGWSSSFPSIRPVIRPVIQVPHPWMEEEDNDDEWRPQQFYPNVISRACSRACWWWGAWAVANNDGHRRWPFLIQKKNTRNLIGDYISQKEREVSYDELRSSW